MQDSPLVARLKREWEASNHHPAYNPFSRLEGEICRLELVLEAMCNDRTRHMMRIERLEAGEAVA